MTTDRSNIGLPRAWTLLAVLLAVFVYFYSLDSQYAPKNGDEFPYAHITRLTAESEPPAAPAVANARYAKHQASAAVLAGNPLDRPGPGLGPVATALPRRPLYAAHGGAHLPPGPAPLGRLRYGNHRRTALPRLFSARIASGVLFSPTPPRCSGFFCPSSPSCTGGARRSNPASCFHSWRAWPSGSGFSTNPSSWWPRMRHAGLVVPARTQLSLRHLSRPGRLESGP